MANYTTTSGFSDLVGSMVATNNVVTSYISNTKGTGSVHPLGGAGLHFQVSFSGVPRPYTINANVAGNGYSGNANTGPATSEETWAATALPAEAADDSSDDLSEDGEAESQDDAATENAPI